MRRLYGRLGVVLAALCCAASAAAQAPSPRIVAVGDLHGDYTAWQAIARAAKLTDQRDRWVGGNAILVQLGDVPDRGPDSLKIIRHLMRLQREAPRKGGRVVALVGNHEAMNMSGDLRYVHPGEYAAFAGRDSVRRREQFFAANKRTIDAFFRARAPKITDSAIRAAWLTENPLGKIEHQAAWSPAGEIGRWTMANPAVAKIGDTVFVHGGISAQYAAMPITEINRRVAAALAARETEPTSILHDEQGPLWYRGLVSRTTGGAAPPPATPAQGAAGSKPAPTIEQEVGIVLQAYGARRIVIAHTPALSGIQLRLGGRLVRIDTGISSYYGGKLSYLELRAGVVTPVYVPRPPPTKQEQF